MSKRKTMVILPLVGILCFILAGALIRHFAGHWENSPPTTVAGPAPSAVSVAETSSPASASPSAVSVSKPKPPEEWVVYVTGAVRSPGVYHLPPNSRVYHLVDSAGGFTSRADPTAVNLAAPLADAFHLHVPDRELPSQTASVREKADVAKTSVKRASSRQVSSARPSSSQPMDLNKADKTALMALPGVGPVIAGRIVEYRQKEGAFRSVEELLKVRGIGPRKLEDIRPLVTVR